MEELFKLVVGIGQCGALSAALAVAVVYQTLQLGRERLKSERRNSQVLEDAVARTKAAEAASTAQQEIALRLIQRRTGGARA